MSKGHSVRRGTSQVKSGEWLNAIGRIDIQDELSGSDIYQNSCQGITKLSAN